MSLLDPPFRETVVQRWARRFSGVAGRYPVMSSPPTVTMQGASSTVNAFTAGNVSHRFDNAALTHIGSTIINDGTNRGVGAGVTFADSSKSASNSPIRTRFMTDAPAFEAVFRGTQFAAIGAIVDGEYISRSRLTVFQNDGNPHYVKFDFGTNTRTYSLAQITKNAGGSGYVVGDTITIAGGTSTQAAVLVVTQVSAGAVALVEPLTIGSYSVVPTGSITQASTSGIGAGATFTGPVWSAQFSTRRMRRIELIWHGSSQKMYGINVDSQSTVLPYPTPLLQPKIAFIGDSITNGTYLDYPGSHVGMSISQRLGLADKAEINAIGGTGWMAVNTTTTPNGPMWSDALRVADFIALNADIYVWWGSQNDGTNYSAVTASVQSVLSQVRAAVPKSYHVGLGPIIVSGQGGLDLSSAVSAGFATQGTSHCRYIDTVAEGWLSGAGKVTGETASGNKDFYLSSDAAHPDQSGLDYLSHQASIRIADELSKVVST